MISCNLRKIILHVYDIIIVVLYHNFDIILYDIILVIYESLPNFCNVTGQS
jgi:hypothetical protein